MLRNDIAHSLSLTTGYVTRVANTASHRYKHFTIPKASGGVRHIYHPAKPLKALQRWLQGAIVAKFPVHRAAAAYRHNKNIADHARIHLKSSFLLRIDLANFFESITADDIAAYFAQHGEHLAASWSDSDTELFLNLVCRDERLTIGAVTSPGLSNALCYPLDSALTARCAEKEVKYTRYADDLFFSTVTPNVLKEMPDIVQEILKTIPYPKSLSVNAAKTEHSSTKGRRRVTGIILTTQGKLSLGRHFKRILRSYLYRFDALDDAQKSRLAGLLAYVKDIEPELFNRLVVKYGVKVLKAAQSLHS